MKDYQRHWMLPTCFSGHLQATTDTGVGDFGHGGGVKTAIANFSDIPRQMVTLRDNACCQEKEVWRAALFT
jgi:hypothetical protein